VGELLQEKPQQLHRREKLIIVVCHGAALNKEAIRDTLAVPAGHARVVGAGVGGTPIVFDK
jgi:hypothetical protein